MASEESSYWNDPDAQWARLYEQTAIADRAYLQEVFALAAQAHEGQCRKRVEGAKCVPYIVHPVRVARLLVEEWRRKDRKTLATALLHDVIEDSAAEIAEEIRRVAGKEVMSSVWTLTKPRLPEPCPSDARAARDARYFSALRHAPAWIRLIKCADRVDNLRDALAWGNRAFWERYSSETIGWHLYLARETAPIAEVALFKALVEGERALRGRAPVWADGRLIDPTAAALVPEHLARHKGIIGLALRGNTLIVGMRDPTDAPTLATVAQMTERTMDAVPISAEALRDALTAHLYGQVGVIPS